MTDKTKPDRLASSVEGEGSYTATRDYQKSVQGFMEKNKDKIDDLAADAERALDGPEGDELRQAETEGLKKGRH
ncbi:MAG: hypothetical protein WDN76_11670 [Alphaproteobacteria bacterium]